MRELRQTKRRLKGWKAEAGGDTWRQGAADGGRLEVGRSGKAEGWKGEETEREGDGHERGRKTEGKLQPRQRAASVINNVRPTFDRQSGAAGAPGPRVRYVTNTHSEREHLTDRDIVLNEK